jgi:hypothetical protein
VTTRTLLPALASVLVLAGCGGSSSPAASKPDGIPSTAVGVGSSPSAPAPGGSAAASTSGGAAAGKTTGTAATTSGGTGTAGSTTTGAATDNGGTSSPFAAPGTYTYDTSGTVTAGSSRDASGTATLTVDPPAAGRQHSLLGNDQGRTEQDVTVKTGGTFLVKLVITNPAFDKTFQPPSPVLLVPDPPTTGRTWSWTAKSTDGKTTAAVTARIKGQETLTIGGTPTPTTLIESTLQLTGDITYTAHMQNWVDRAHRLSVKDHTKGEGSFGAVTFTSDITSVIRTTKPS